MVFHQFRLQIENLKKELEVNNDNHQRMKRNYEDQINNQFIKEKVIWQ